MENKVVFNEFQVFEEAKRKGLPFYVIARRNDSLLRQFGEAIFYARKSLKLFTFFCLLFTFSSCNFDTVVDTNQSMENNRWLYANAAKAEFDIKDATKSYQVNFKLRINTEYRFSNLYVLATMKDAKSRKRIRYQFKVAKEDGAWLGKGSGDLYTYTFPLLKNHRFADTGKYSIEIEQNMRDNPLVGVSDVGIEVK